jgi:hypothetical protein
VESKVLEKKGRHFAINKQWILEAAKFVNQLQKQYFSEDQKVEKIAVSSNVATYTFSRLVDSDVMWNTIIEDNFANNPNHPKIITFSAEHFWWVIATPVQEAELYRSMQKKGITTYFIGYGNTPLDKWTTDYYKGIKVHCKQIPKPKNFPPGHNAGTYGDIIIQVTYPPKLAQRIKDFFRKHKQVAQTNLPELVEITTEKHEIVLTVIRDATLAASMREGNIRHFKK